MDVGYRFPANRNMCIRLDYEPFQDYGFTMIWANSAMESFKNKLSKLTIKPSWVIWIRIWGGRIGEEGRLWVVIDRCTV